MFTLIRAACAWLRLAWFVQRARCPHCRTRVDFRYGTTSCSYCGGVL